MGGLGRLLRRIWPAGGFFRQSGVKASGPNSLVVEIEGHSYWVQATHGHQQCQVWTSDVRDITRAATVVAAPPAPSEVVPEVRRRLEDYFSASRIRVIHR